jgi:hypothetical protein
VRCITLTGQVAFPRRAAKQSRRLDSHQYQPAYEAGAFLARATSANQGARRGLNPHPSVHSRSCRNHYTTSPRNRAEGAGVEPARQLRSPGFQPGTVALRLALPISQPSPVPRPGIEPGTSRSKRGMISVSPSGRQWRRRESNPTQFACKAISPPWNMRPQL